MYMNSEALQDRWASDGSKTPSSSAGTPSIFTANAGPMDDQFSDRDAMDVDKQTFGVFNVFLYCIVVLILMRRIRRLETDAAAATPSQSEPNSDVESSSERLS